MLFIIISVLVGGLAINSSALTRDQALEILGRYREHPGRHIKTAAGEMAQEMQIDGALAIQLLNAFKKKTQQFDPLLADAIRTSALPDPAAPHAMGFLPPPPPHVSPPHSPVPDPAFVHEQEARARARRNWRLFKVKAKAIAAFAQSGEEAERKRDAALKIQAAFRGHKGRQEAARRRDAAAAIAALPPPAPAADPAFVDEQTQRSNAAIKLQAIFRGRKGRQEAERRRAEAAIGALPPPAPHLLGTPPHTPPHVSPPPHPVPGAHANVAPVGGGRAGLLAGIHAGQPLRAINKDHLDKPLPSQAEIEKEKLESAAALRKAQQQELDATEARVQQLLSKRKQHDTTQKAYEKNVLRYREEQRRRSDIVHKLEGEKRSLQEKLSQATGAHARTQAQANFDRKERELGDAQRQLSDLPPPALPSEPLTAREKEELQTLMHRSEELRRILGAGALHTIAQHPFLNKQHSSSDSSDGEDWDD